MAIGQHFYANRHEFDTSLMPGSFDHGEQMDGIEPENTYPDHPLRKYKGAIKSVLELVSRLRYECRSSFASQDGVAAR